ncbi:MAG: methyltransferase domain-containing protein [Promethearchaeota archaeon]
MIPYTIVFTVNNLKKEEITGKSVLEVGAYDVNGSLRPIIKMWNPSQYIGVDIQKGPGVDVICNAEDLEERFGSESFDIILSSDTLEHIYNWRGAISNIKKICKPNGILILSVPSIGFPYHSYPHDYWRYEINDIQDIFSDFEIQIIENSYPYSGVLIKVKKPQNFKENNLDTIMLYSIIAKKRVINISSTTIDDFIKNRRKIPNDL